MTKLEVYALLSDAIGSITATKNQLEGIQEALHEVIDWDALEGTDTQPER